MRKITWCDLQRSDVHNTNASTSEHACETSSADDEICRSAHLIICKKALRLIVFDAVALAACAH